MLHTRGLKRMKAYMSVEASMLMPFVLSVLFFLLYAFFLVYNRCLAEFDMGHLLVTAVRSEGNVNEIAESVLQEERAIQKEKYYGYHQTEMTSELKNGKVSLEQRGRLDFPGTRSWELRVSYQAAFYRPAHRLRQWNRIKEVSSCIRKENQEYVKNGLHTQSSGELSAN